MNRRRHRMPAYRFHLVGPKREILGEPVIADLDNDGEAFVRATQLRSAECGAEAWQQERLVCHVPAKRSSNDHHAAVE